MKEDTEKIAKVAYDWQSDDCDYQCEELYPENHCENAGVYKMALAFVLEY